MDTFKRPVSVISLAVLMVTLLLGQAAAKESLFPLSPGNSWTYRDLDGNLETLSLTTVSESGGVPLIEASYDGTRPFHYIRTTEGVFRLQPVSTTLSEEPRGHLTLLLQWPLIPGRTWQSPWTDPPLSFTVLDRGEVKVAAGSFRDGVKIGYRPVSSPIYQGYIWFKPGIGILAQEKSAHRTELVSYTLGDLLPPDAVGVDGDRLAEIFRPPVLEQAGTGEGFWPRLKSLALSGPFYLFMLLVFLGILSVSGYMKARKVELDVKDDPDVQEGELTLAAAMVRQGLYEDACRILQRLTARHPQWPDIAALLGRSYRETGKFDEACLELKRALTLNPDMAKARLELVRTYLNLNEPSRALEEVETVLADNRGFADAVYLKGEVLADMDLNEDAARCFREALQINPSFAEAQAALERILAEGDLTSDAQTR